MVMKNKSIGIWLAVMLTAMIAGCYSLPNNAGKSPKQAEFVNTTLAQLLSNIDPWCNPHSANSTFADENWTRLVNIAVQIQTNRPENVCKFLREYQSNRRQDSEQVDMDDSKVYLLMRVVFDLPEHAKTNRVAFGNWVTMRTEINGDGTINHAWPITWNHGKPKVVSRCFGIQGFGRYDAAAEFNYFRKNYPYRDLGTKGLASRKKTTTPNAPASTPQ
jgi:hypothetical protein